MWRTLVTTCRMLGFLKHHAFFSEKFGVSLNTHVFIFCLMKYLFFAPLPNMSEIYRGTPVTKEIHGMLDFLELWASNTTKLWAVHILLGVVATFFSLLTAAGIQSIGAGYSQIFAFIAALSISMMTAFNLGR